MGNPKTKAKVTAKPAPAAASGEDVRAEQVRFDQERTALPEPSAALRAGFVRTRSAERCRELGGGTRAAEVAKEARRTLLGVVESVKSHGAGLRFRPERLRFAMDLVHELERSIDRQSEGVAARRAVASHRVRAESDAAAARKELIDALEPVVDALDAEAAAFALARGDLGAGTDLAKSLETLAEQGKRWLSHEDLSLRALAEHQGITESLVHRAILAATALRAARDETAFTGGRPPIDSPESNELEGRVLFELGELYSAFERNRGETGVALPRLGAITLRALRKGSSAKANKADPPAPT